MALTKLRTPGPGLRAEWTARPRAWLDAAKASRALAFAAVLAAVLAAGVFAWSWLRVQNCLRAAEGDNVVARQEAVAALGRLGARGALPLLERLAADASLDEATRRVAVAALGDVGAASSLDVLVKLLDAPEPSLVEAAAVALGRLKDGRAVGPLVRVAREKRARLAVLWSLGAIGDPRAVPLLNLELSDPDVYVAYNARQALRRIAGQQDGY